MARKVLLVILGWIVGSLGFCGWAQGQGPQSASPGIEKGTQGTAAAPAVVMVYHRPMVAFRVPLLGFSPQERARGTEERIHALIESGQIGAVITRPSSEGTIFSVGDRGMFLASPGDLDPVAGDSMEQVAQRVVKNLTVALDEAREEQPGNPVPPKAEFKRCWIAVPGLLPVGTGLS